ncbi:ZIP family metal transporter [Rubrobacter aplysinae]|uniref:ZIP family metal transporter n=1 Tax=Rubrobacter aplysinae TaxID=909625 RepID=UPI00064C3D13|nr:ZIP family metal transporter [Rubrobacter aplysinae]
MTLLVFLLALFTALATGLGAVPFAFTHDPARRWIGASNAAAAGLMLAASVWLAYEGLGRGMLGVLVGAAVGAISILAVRRYLGLDEHPAVFAGMSGLDARKGLLIVAIMTAHSLAEGVGVGVAFGGGEDLGVIIALAIAVHNIPEGLAISLVLVPRGVSPGKAAFWSIFSSLPQPLMAVPAFMFVEAFETLLPYGLGFAAGAMVWMVFAELLPDARKDAPDRTILVVLAVSAASMMAFQLLLS